MPAIRFTKAHGAGNDFVIVEGRELAEIGIGADALPEFAAKICDRRCGVGADGLEVVSPSSDPQAVAQLHLWNCDGSEAELSGNGTRCVAAYLTESLGAPERFSVETVAGVREIERTLAKAPYYEFRMTTDESECRVLEAQPVGEGAEPAWRDDRCPCRQSAVRGSRGELGLRLADVGADLGTGSRVFPKGPMFRS